MPRDYSAAVARLIAEAHKLRDMTAGDYQVSVLNAMATDGAAPEVLAMMAGRPANGEEGAQLV